MESIGYKSRNSYTITDLINFYKNHNRLPSIHIKREKGLYQWMSRERKRGNKEVMEFLKSTGYKSPTFYTITDLINFYKTHNRLPNQHIKEESLYKWMYREKRRRNKEILNFLSLVNNRDIPEIKELLLTI